jgi:hypothetical protein
MKGQTAIEYLMTYGWAILIILIVAGVLAYYGIFAPAGFLGPSKTGFAQVDVIQPWDLDSLGNLDVILENRVGQEIRVVQIYADSDSGISFVDDITDEIIPTGARTSTYITASFVNLTGNSGSTYKLYVSLEYVLTSYPTQFMNSTGTLSGTRS